MRKFAVIFSAAIVLVIVLVVSAFFYVDMSAHRVASYEISRDGAPFGTTRVDRYETEGKIIYKSARESPHSEGYISGSEKLILDKHSMMPLKFVEEAKGVKGQGRTTILLQDGDSTDFLFLEHPRYISIKGFSTGEKTMVFSPEDVMLYMPIMERYNYWEKGTQFFEVMVPTGEPLPPMRDKIAVRYTGDEYIDVMGRRTETEGFTISAGSLPDAKVFVLKYSHSIAVLEVPKSGKRTSLMQRSESHGKRLDAIRNWFSGLGKPGSSELPGIPEEEEAAKDPSAIGEVGSEKEVFFQCGRFLLSGKVNTPVGAGPFPAVILVPRDGPMTVGEDLMMGAMSRMLSGEGFCVLEFDGPGQGKSQGNFSDVTDGVRIEAIEAAITFMEGYPEVCKNGINLAGHEGGGYLVMKASASRVSVRSCILLSLPLDPEESDFFREPSIENLQVFLSSRGFGSFSDGYMATVTDVMRSMLSKIKGGGNSPVFALGMKLPSGAYEEYLGRSYYRMVLAFRKPFLLVLGRNNILARPAMVSALKKALREAESPGVVSTFRNLGPYLGDVGIEKNGRKGFVLDEDVVALIIAWLRENGVPVGLQDETLLGEDEGMI